MKTRVAVLVIIVVAALVALGYMFFGGGDFNFGQTNVLGVEENVDVDVGDGDNYDIALRKFSYDSLEDDTLTFRVEFPEGKESVISFIILDEAGEVVNSAQYSTIHLRGDETSPSNIVLPIEWSGDGTYHVEMEIVDRVSGELVYEGYANFVYR